MATGLAAPGLARPAADTPTGLHRAEIAGLTDDDLRLLAAWHLTVAGDDDSKPWWPNAVRVLPADMRMRLATDASADAAWKELQRRAVAESALHFTTAFGHVQPPTGAPLPFDLWDPTPDGADRSIGGEGQEDVIRALDEHGRIIVLKARQLGLTWLVLHYCIWLMAFNPKTPNAKVLALSKHGGDASKLVARARRIVRLLPRFIRPEEDTATRQALQRFSLVGAGAMTSLAGSPEAARSETATFVLADEFAFIRNRSAGPTWTALLPTLGDTGKLAIISTGNGPEEAPGDGQAFAQLWTRARTGDTEASAGLMPIFLPSSTHPERDDAWRSKTRGQFLHDEDFEAEYPETEEQALAGQSGTKVYLPAGVTAAEKLGRHYDDLLFRGQLLPYGGVVHATFDFGEFTHVLPIWPLEGGGVYVPPGEVDGGGHLSMTVRDTALQFLKNIEPWQAPGDGEPIIPLKEFRYDAAGIESARTALEVFEENGIHRWQYVLRFKNQLGRKVQSVTLNGVAFGRWKNFTIDYLRHLFKRTAAGETVRVIAISPANTVLLRQLRGYELDEVGNIVKGDDHACDSLLAGVKPIAHQFKSMMPAAKRGADEPPEENR